MIDWTQHKMQISTIEHSIIDNNKSLCEIAHTVEIVTSRSATVTAVSVEVPSALILIVAVIVATAVASVIVIVHILRSSTSEVIHIAMITLYRILWWALLWTFIEASPNLFLFYFLLNTKFCEKYFVLDNCDRFAIHSLQ